MIKISFMTSKGGVSKSTSALETVASLRKRGYRTLLVDMDCQGSASVACGFDIDDESLPTLERVLAGEDIRTVIQHDTPFGDLVPNNLKLFDADYMYSGKIGSRQIVRKALEKVEDDYDFVILDCPPSFGFASLSSLVASDYVIVPQLASMFSLISLKQLDTVYTLIKDNENADLKVLGIFLTKYNPRTRFSRDITTVLEDFAKKYFNAPVFKTKIRNAIAVEESILANQNIYDYAPGSKVSEDFSALVDEILDMLDMPIEKEKNNG